MIGYNVSTITLASFPAWDFVSQPWR